MSEKLSEKGKLMIGKYSPEAVLDAISFEIKDFLPCFKQKLLHNHRA